MYQIVSISVHIPSEVSPARRHRFDMIQDKSHREIDPALIGRYRRRFCNVFLYGRLMSPPSWPRIDESNSHDAVHFPGANHRVSIRDKGSVSLGASFRSRRPQEIALKLGFMRLVNCDTDLHIEDGIRKAPDLNVATRTTRGGPYHGNMEASGDEVTARAASTRQSRDRE